MKKSIILLLALFCFAIESMACTSAIISGKVTQNGRPLLWKNRDTSAENNVIDRVKATDKNYEYVALYNAEDTARLEAWMGFNEKGFAIMNTHSYNIRTDKMDIKMDNEGVFMAEALATCADVADFEKMLNTHKRPLSVEANFGVIDAQGNGAYFEVNNFEYKKYDLKDSPNGVLTRTNFSYSGTNGKGMGQLREQSTWDLLTPYIEKKSITPALFTEEISREFYCAEGKKNCAITADSVIVYQDFIPRESSTASVVVEGVLPTESPLLTTMWSSVGYPPCAITLPVWLGEDGIPEGFKGTQPNGHSAYCDNAINVKHKVYWGPKKRNINIKMLYNENGSGMTQQIKAINAENYRVGYEKLAKKRKELTK